MCHRAQSRLSALVHDPGFMHTFFHGRSGEGTFDPAMLRRFDREYDARPDPRRPALALSATPSSFGRYALINTLYVLVEPFYYLLRAREEVARSMLGAEAADARPRMQARPPSSPLASRALARAFYPCTYLDGHRSSTRV